MKGQTKSATPPKPRTAAAEAPKTPPKFIELIPPNPGIDFVRLAPMMIGVSWLVILLGLGSVWLHGGLNYGIDFVGGTMLEVRFPNPTSITDVRAALEDANLGEVIVQDVGRERKDFQVRLRGSGQETGSTIADAVKAGLKDKFGEGAYDILRIETVGPKVGKQLWRNATLAVLAATVMMGMYIWFRFDLRFGIGAAIALIHDVLITIGALSLANMEFDLTTVVALLTIVGFSVHDTVIISDRIRENMRKMRRDNMATIINVSINETLSRSIITSGTAILTTAALFVLGGNVIHSFAFALLVGFVVGTYSSIYVASPIVLYLDRRNRPKT